MGLFDSDKSNDVLRTDESENKRYLSQSIGLHPQVPTSTIRTTPLYEIGGPKVTSPLARYIPQPNSSRTTYQSVVTITPVPKSKLERPNQAERGKDVSTRGPWTKTGPFYNPLSSQPEISNIGRLSRSQYKNK